MNIPAQLLRRSMLFALAGVLVLGLSGCGSPAVEEGTTMEEFNGTMEDLMARGRDVTCTFTQTDDAGMTKGTVYITQDGRMRGEFTNEGDEGPMAMHMINDGEYSYTWGVPSMNKGVKMKLDDEEDNSIMDDDDEDDDDDAEEMVDMDESMEYRCSTWRADASKFVPPSDIEFQDLSAMMQGVLEGMGNVDCSVCDSMPDEAAMSQCKQAMGCA